MRIAIVDDNREFSRLIEAAVYRFFEDKEESVSVHMFCNGDELLADTDILGDCELFLLDVEMPGTDGLELAGRIRANRRSAQIAFVTSHEKYAFRSIKLGIYYYMLKSEYEEELPSILTKIYRNYQEERQEYILKETKTETRLRIKNIRYLSKDGKYVIFHYGEKEVSERSSLDEVCKRMPEGKFIFIGRGTVINVDHVVDIRDHGVEITGGHVFKISRFYYPSAMEVLTNYLGKR